MCGRSHAVRGMGFGRRRPDFFGIDVEELGARQKVAVALSVLGPVVLSGVFLVVFVPGLWWIFTTYFWISFPAIALLGSGLAGLGADLPSRPAVRDPERELLVALRERGEMTSARAAAETSLSVGEADRRLRGLADAGHLEIRARGGGIFYALWEDGRRVRGGQ